MNTSALAALCQREGGTKTVAAAIECNYQTLYQVIAGIPLKSGKPRSLGRDLQDRLDARYPGWRSLADHPVIRGSDSIVIGNHPETVDDINDIVIRQFDTGGAMGSGLVLQEQPGIIKEWRVSDEWLRLNVHRVTSPNNLAIVTGFGPSMKPVYNPGDPLLVDRGITVVDVDGVYFFRVGNEGFVKQLQRIPTANGLVIRAKSYNSLYDPFDITEGMDFEVFARVVKVWKGEEF